MCLVCTDYVRVGAEDGMATEDDEDDEDLLPAEMHAEPASTAEAAQHAAQVAGQVRQAEIQERTRLEEDAIGTYMCAGAYMCTGAYTHSIQADCVYACTLVSCKQHAARSIRGMHAL